MADGVEGGGYRGPEKPDTPQEVLEMPQVAVD